jgi:hypothetical protein
MTDSNRLRLSVVKEATLGTLPGTPRMRTARLTGESLAWAPQFFTPAELRADRMSADPVKVNERNDGGINFEWSYPDSNSALAAFIESAMFSSWVNTPERDNDGTADSVITDIGTTANTLVCTTGAAFGIGHLARTTGFSTAANNTVARVTTGGATSYVAIGAGYVAEVAPPAAARVKVVGLEGAAADITATATGLTTTALNFTTLGIVPGMWLNIGGTATVNKFATAANNGWARVAAVAANGLSLTLDNRPVGWGADVGTGKQIRIFFGDRIINGTTRLGLSIERSFLGQTVPTHILQKGMVVDRLSLDATSEQAITGALAFMGMVGSQGTVANGTTYAAATTGLVLTASVSVGSILLSGTALGSPNWVRSLKVDVANNLRPITAVGSVGAVSIGAGEVGVTGSLETYFGDNTLVAAQFAGTIGAIAARATANNQAVCWTLPRVIFGEGSPNAGGKNQDVVLPLTFTASADSTTSSEFDIQRLEYFEV